MISMDSFTGKFTPNNCFCPQLRCDFPATFPSADSGKIEKSTMECRSSSWPKNNEFCKPILTYAVPINVYIKHQKKCAKPQKIV